MSAFITGWASGKIRFFMLVLMSWSISAVAGWDAGWDAGAQPQRGHAQALGEGSQHWQQPAADEGLFQRMEREGAIPVIVRLRVDPQHEGDRRFALSAKAPPGEIATVRRKVLERLPGLRLNPQKRANVKAFEQFEGFAMQADAADLSDLLADPDVLQVVEDVAHPPMLAASVPHLGGWADGSFEGYSGAGQTIAVLDTGVARSHPFLLGKVVSEACYSTNFAAAGVASLCPGGVASSTAPGSGVNCDSSLAGCRHGTHVAGIAAGRGSAFAGVARDANLIAVQVFSRFPASACGGSAPCVLAYTSDIIRGLERVHALHTEFSIAAANLSLGGGRHTGACDGDPVQPLVMSLRAVGIPTIIASGNDGYADALASPACVSAAISVGSSSLSDQVSGFSNSAPFLDLLAPGASINSSVPGSGYARMSGTSMAAPHVSGAWAVLKSVAPDASVDHVLSVLSVAGVAVEDARNGLVKPRIDVAEAVRLLADDLPPSPPEWPPLPGRVFDPVVLAGPDRLVLEWMPVEHATSYRVEVAITSQFTSYVRGFEDRDTLGQTSVSVTGLTPGKTYYVRVRATNLAGAGPASYPIRVRTQR